MQRQYRTGTHKLLFYLECNPVAEASPRSAERLHLASFSVRCCVFRRRHFLCRAAMLGRRRCIFTDSVTTGPQLPSLQQWVHLLTEDQVPHRPHRTSHVKPLSQLDSVRGTDPQKCIGIGPLENHRSAGWYNSLARAFACADVVTPPAALMRQ